MTKSKISFLKFKYKSLIFLLLFFIGCSTQKDAVINKWYHQLNTKYNGLFYAQEHLKTGVKKITESHKDNYKEIITINQYGTIKDAQSAQSSLDQAIEKSTLAIKKHSMDIDGDEKNKFIHKAYFIIGQAKFYKQDYVGAVNTFNYIVRKSSDTEMQSESVLWSTRCQHQLKNHEALSNNIEMLEDDYYLTKRQDAILFEIKSELAIAQEDFKGAKTYLSKAIRLSKNKNKKTRMNYILGQIQLITKDYNEAINSFQKVVKSNPKYELVFNAKLNQTKAYDPNKNSFQSLKKTLDKMLNDKKNNEYQDQIYFALAQMELKNLDTISAIQSFRFSAQFSIDNNTQKVESHHALAQLFWDKKDYVNAHNHSDSAYQFVKSTNLKYDEIKNLFRNSKKIANLYNFINHNDSIIHLARLPDDERNVIIDEYIANLKKEEEELKSANERGTGGGAFNSYEYNKQTQNSMSITSGGGWYFYNPSAISLGYSEFLSRWGNRKLEDNWRRKNKNQILTIEEMEEDSLSQGPTEKEKYSRDYYLSRLPLEEQEQLILLSKIETAYYDLSGIFKSDLTDYNQSIMLYAELMERFPETDYRQLIYFDLHNIFNLKGDTVRANEFLFKIEQEYPNSNYLEVLSGNAPINPQLEADKQIYRTAHGLYVEFTEKSCQELQTIFLNNSNNIFIAEMELLNAFCQAKQSEKKEFVNTLEEIKNKYPKSNISAKIDTILLILTGEKDFSLNTIYKNEFETPHYFFLVLRDVSINLPETQLAISNFNDKNYKLDSLSITNLLLNKELQLLKVAEFKNKLQALTYYDLIQENKITEELFNNASITPLVISRDNFSELLKERNINTYIEYFNKIYLLN